MHTLPQTAEHPALAVLPEFPTREQIEDFGRYLQSLEADHGQPDIGTAHHLAGDVYGRSVVIQRDTYLVGLPHREAHLNVCVGDITVWTDTGRVRLTGAHILPAKAGVMRVGFAHADTTWLSVHVNRTGGKDIASIEDSLVEGAERLLSRRQVDRADYERFLQAYGFTEDFVRGVVEDMRDHADMPNGHDHLTLRESSLQGFGVFTSRAIAQGEAIGPARIGQRRTLLGRRMNHSATPNCAFEQDGTGGLSVRALRWIPEDAELTVSYWQAGEVNGSLPPKRIAA